MNIAKPKQLKVVSDKKSIKNRADSSKKVSK